MIFICVVFGAVLAGIFLIHWVAEYLGYEMKYKSLVLCAVMALGVSFAVILWTPYLTPELYIRMGLLVFATALVVTLIDRWLTSGKIPEERTVPYLGEEMLPVTGKESNASDYTFEPMAGELTGVQDSAEAEERKSDSGPEIFDFSFQQSDLPDTEETADGESLEGAFQENIAVPADMPLDSLDSLLDYAMKQKEAGEREKEILSYRKGLELFGTDEYAPFLAINLGNVYKENADYEEAVRVYQEALRLPIIAENDAMYQEFARNISYLRTVQYILFKHDALEMPFLKIPPEYLEEIEEEFQAQPEQDQPSKLQ